VRKKPKSPKGEEGSATADFAEAEPDPSDMSVFDRAMRGIIRVNKTDIKTSRTTGKKIKSRD
jgi:hypothetical protein